MKNIHDEEKKKIEMLFSFVECTILGFVGDNVLVFGQMQTFALLKMVVVV